MIRALVEDGVLKPLDPLPPEWSDGRTVEITGDVQVEDDLADLDTWYRELEQGIAENPMRPEDIRQLRKFFSNSNAQDESFLRLT